jgi:hypothetical protein
VRGDGFSEGSGKKSKKLKHAHSTIVGGINPVSGAPIAVGSNGDDSEMIMHYEKRIGDLMLTLQK